MAAGVVAVSPGVVLLGSVNSEPESSALLCLHDSLLQDILRRIDIQSRVAASVSCRRLARVSAEHPPSVVDLSSDGVHPEACRRYIENAKGAIVTLATARQQQRNACDATSARRFNTGVRCTQVVPYTSGPSAARLAAVLPNLQHLALHEATSCLGGMTDEFAMAVAANCPHLNHLEVAFTRYSLPSEFFTDAGMMALAAGCPRLSCLSLTNCGAITDRSLYAVAVHCRGLRRLALGGYHELISDYGTVILFQACSGLVRVVLSGKLRRVTDESVEALAANSGAVLQEVKLTRSMGDQSLAALATHCKALQLVDCCKCEPGAVTPQGVACMIKTLAARQQQQPQQQQQQQHQLPKAAAATVSDTAAVTVSAGHVAAATAAGGCGRRGGSSSDSSSGSPLSCCVLRVVLPKGVSAADVVQLVQADGGGAAGAHLRAASSPAPLPTSGGKEASAAAAGTGYGTAAATAVVSASVLKLGSTGGVGDANRSQAGVTGGNSAFEEVVVRLP